MVATHIFKTSITVPQDLAFLDDNDTKGLSIRDDNSRGGEDGEREMMSLPRRRWPWNQMFRDVLPEHR
ncbi:hypothetical protein NHX12_030160 [Muraenolepis orangiensis]|uniref:Uncharacterized protein n=1 Tax=Muraenolepis orangiensis TaxID=630683 RepID=A0A9Q0EBJ2_9TELE|nr:hypothetical protein NHX12_030160 [Muraenolepis orangiensis]